VGSELLNLLEQEARVEQDKILAEARAKADDILAAARREAEDVVTATQRRLETEADQARTRAASTASLRASALVLAAKDEALRKVFEQAEAELRAAAADAARRRMMLRVFLREAAQGLPPGRSIAEVAPGDVSVVQDLCRELRLDLDVRASNDVRDGVRLVSEDGRAVVENTLASRLARVRREMVSRVAEILWGA
jgi:V/A-type H+/Na+-transporting ATPase subunit E